MSRVGVLSLARTQHLQINVLFTPKNIRNLGIPPKNIIATPKKKKIQFCTLTFRKSLKCIDAIIFLVAHTHQIVQFCNIHNFFIPQKIFIFLKTQTILKLKILNPQKWSEPKYICKLGRVCIPNTCRRYLKMFKDNRWTCNVPTSGRLSSSSVMSYLGLIVNF